MVIMTRLGLNRIRKIFVANTQLVDTGGINDVEDYSQVGFEIAVNYNRFNVQSEYIQSSVNTGTENLDFSSWYMQSSLFLTNDRRAYKKGKFGIVKPQSILGQNGSWAWELAMRYSEIDLSNGSVFGGLERNMTLALNLFATPEIRFTVEYLKVLDVSENNLMTEDAKNYLEETCHSGIPINLYEHVKRITDQDIYVSVSN